MFSYAIQKPIYESKVMQTITSKLVGGQHCSLSYSISGSRRLTH